MVVHVYVGERGGGHGNIYGAHMLLNTRTLKQRFAAATDASWELVNW